MARLEDLVHGRSPLTAQHIHRIQELVADWQLLADLSFADLVLWVPLRKISKAGQLDTLQLLTSVQRLRQLFFLTM